MYRNRPLDLCRPTFFEVTPRVLRQRASNTRGSGLGWPSFGGALEDRPSGFGCRRTRPRTHAYARVPAVAGTPHAHARTPARMARTPTHAHARPPGRRPRAHLRAHAGPRAPALRPSCRRHDARKFRDLGPRSAPRRRGDGARPGPRPPTAGPRPPSRPPRSGPRERLATDLHGGSRHKRDASAENGTLAEFSGVSQYPCRTPGGDRAVAGLFSVGPPGDGYPMATLLSFLQRPPTRTRPYTRARGN